MNRKKKKKKDPTFAQSMAKYFPELCYFEFNPIDFEKAWGKIKTAD